MGYSEKAQALYLAATISRCPVGARPSPPAPRARAQQAAARMRRVFVLHLRGAAASHPGRQMNRDERKSGARGSVACALCGGAPRAPRRHSAPYLRLPRFTCTTKVQVPKDNKTNEFNLTASVGFLRWQAPSPSPAHAPSCAALTALLRPTLGCHVPCHAPPSLLRALVAVVVATGAVLGRRWRVCWRRRAVLGGCGVAAAPRAVLRRRRRVAW